MDKSPVTSLPFAFVLLFFSTCVGAGAALIAMALTMHGDWLRAGAVTGSIAGTVALIVSLLWWNNLVRETLGIQSSYEPPERLYLEVKMLDTGQKLWSQLANVDEYILTELALHIRRGGHITYRSCEKLFGDSKKFAAFQDSMVAAHYAEWR